MADTDTNGHPDAFANADLEEATGRLVALIRAEQPQAVLTYDGRGGSPHPHPIRTHAVSMAPFHPAGGPDRFPEAGPPWQPLKLYYHATFTRERIEMIHKGVVERGLESPFAEWLGRGGEGEHG